MTSLRRALLLASAVMVWQGCSLNDSGLTSDGGPPNDAGTGGLRTDGPVAGMGGSAAGGRGGAGGSASGVAGSVAGTSGSTGGNVAGAGGAAGSSVAGAGGGVAGAGGSVTGVAGSVAGAAGSVAGAGGSVGGAGAGVGGSVAGAGGQGMAGAGGTAGGVSGVGGSVAGMGGSVAGMGGRGGAGMAGRGGAGGRGGVGGRACMGYPTNARAFIPPTDNRVHCYWTHGNMQSFSQARQTCSNEDGHLVSILSEEENLFVVSIAQFSPMYSDTWIGATDGRQGSDARGPGNYTWVTGETWNFDAWGTGEPDGACDQPCSGMNCSCDHRGTLVSDGTWSDRYESTTRGFVCEATP